MMSDETLDVADIAEILRLLPHRHPFLLIDRVIDIRGEDHGIGIRNLTMNEPQFGHSAENPVIPGVLVIEGIAQTACVLALRLMPRTSGSAPCFSCPSTKPSSANQRAAATRSNITSTSSRAVATSGGIAAKRRSAVC